MITLHHGDPISVLPDAVSRVVKAQAISFVKPLPERIGSDIERFLLDQAVHHLISESLHVGSVSFRH